MVRIKCTANVTDETWNILNSSKRPATATLLALPLDCIEELQIVHNARNDRVAELEAELARAMFYITAQKDCAACKHGGREPAFCPADCSECCMAGSCVCGSCFDGSKWEWVGANGNERAAAPGSDR